MKKYYNSGATVLSAALRHNSTLKVLEIPGNNISAAGAAEVVWKI